MVVCRRIENYRVDGTTSEVKHHSSSGPNRYLNRHDNGNRQCFFATTLTRNLKSVFSSSQPERVAGGGFVVRPSVVGCGARAVEQVEVAAPANRVATDRIAR
jgi:hypothetical protein